MNRSQSVQVCNRLLEPRPFFITFVLEFIHGTSSFHRTSFGILHSIVPRFGSGLSFGPCEALLGYSFLQIENNDRAIN